MSHYAILQGSFRAPAAATVRVVWDPNASGPGPIPIDWSIIAGDTWRSAAEAIADWQATIDSAIGPGIIELMLDAYEDEHYQRLRVTVAGGEDVSIAWSHAGDGTALRDWLGEVGDVLDVDGYVFISHVRATYVARWGAVVAHRLSTGRWASHTIRVDGTSEATHARILGDPDDVDLDVRLSTGKPAGALTWTQHKRLRDWMEELLVSTGGGEPWALCATGEDGTEWWYYLRLADAPLRLVPEQMPGEPGRRWTITIRATAAGALPW